MTEIAQQIIERVENLNTYRRGTRRAPHKPLLLLLALSQLKQGRKEIKFGEIEDDLRSLLNVYAPPVSSRHQPELPFWHLQSDSLWVVQGSDLLPRQRSGFPALANLRDAKAGFPDEVADAFLTQSGLIDRIVLLILDEHFPPSVHGDLLAATGLGVVSQQWQIREIGGITRHRRTRDPSFRDKVLRAYEHRCAVTGFRAALGGSYFGCEAGHVQWHAYGGPDVVANGISMEPTIHKLFDSGAWTLTDDHRILVSAEYTGSDIALDRLRDHHGKTIRKPIAGEPMVDQEFILWHREPDLGGVFRSPALSL